MKNVREKLFIFDKLGNNIIEEPVVFTKRDWRVEFRNKYCNLRKVCSRKLSNYRWLLNHLREYRG